MIAKHINIRKQLIIFALIVSVKLNETNGKFHDS